ncbi:putative acetyltransferase [Camellia lanceoleosa]|uniref:Acetyltransferase n=1 Tax=Camellia lanceoleosa TaxID=1840588 RepID=A0ACC0IEW3_9ERIC|nr:putative acetyltransferase [Camellia lanceoleosa]
MNDQENTVQVLLERLKESLSLTLDPLAGWLATSKQENPPHYSIYIDNDNSPGAKFIHAAVNLTVSDMLSPVDVPLVVQSVFDHDRAINHDGHTLSLLSIQLTELVDGIFIGFGISSILGRTFS